MRRSIGIGLLTVLAGASVLLSSDLGARPAGSSAAHSVPAAGAVRPAGSLRGSWIPRDAGFFHRQHNIRHFGNNWGSGFWGGSPWYDYNNYGAGHYDGYTGYNGTPGYGTPYTTPTPPSAYSGGPYPPAISTPDSKQVIYVVPYRPGCETKTETLPGRNGSEHSVRIVRC